MKPASNPSGSNGAKDSAVPAGPMPQHSARPLACLGASVRALAASAFQAGCAVRGFDLFADRDLQLLGPATRIALERYPHGFLEFVEEIAEREWAYTGGLENYPELLDRLARSSRLLGNGGAVVRRARDPLAFAEAIRNIADRCPGIAVPEARSRPHGLPLDGSWLRKPNRGSGGRDIAPWRGQHTPIESHWHWQHLATGVAHSAVFVANDRQAILTGVTRQLVGAPFCNAAPFQYCGNILLRVDSTLKQRVHAIGAGLARQFGIRGVFGLDFLLDDSTLRPIEVNPRWPASAEIVEVAAGRSLFPLHRDCFASPSAVLDDADWRATPSTAVGKAIYFASGKGRLNCDLLNESPPGSAIRFADIPAVGTSFKAGEPVATVLATALDDRRVEWELQAGCHFLAGSLGN